MYFRSMNPTKKVIIILVTVFIVGFIVSQLSLSLTSLFFFVFFFLEKPGQPVVSVTSLNARTATVTWSYSPGANEFPTSFTVQYQNRTFSDILSLKPGNSLSTVLTHLKPFADYNVTVKASSFLGDGSSTRNIKTLTARMWIV